MPAEDGRTDGGCRRCPRQETRGGEERGGEGWPGRPRPGQPRPLSPPQGAGSAEAGAKQHPPGQKPRAGGGQSPRALGRAPRDAAQAAPSAGMAGRGCPSRLAPLLVLALLWPGRAAAAAEVSERGTEGLGWRGVPQRLERHLGRCGA